MPQDLTLEDQLCLLLARGQLPARAGDRALELLRAPLRWDRLLGRASLHEVTPLVYRNLATLGFPGVPNSARAELAAAFRANAVRSMLFAEELRCVLRILSEAGVPGIPL